MYRASLTDELLRIMDENPHSLHDDQISATLRGEMAVMRLLGGSGEQRQLAAGEISRRLSMTTSRIAAVLNSLERKQMIVRKPDPHDKRRVMVTLTEQGKAFCSEKHRCFRKRAARFFELLGEEDARDFVRLMRRVVQILSSEEWAQDRACGELKTVDPKEELHE